MVERDFLVRVLRGESADPTHIDWPQLLAVARPFLHPMLLHCLQQANVPIPSEVAAQLKQSLRENTFTYLARRGELQRILIAADQAGLRPLVLKGMVLGHTIYPRPELRPMADIDLLIEPDKLEAMSQLLTRRGWQIDANTRDVGEHEHEEALTFFHADSRTSIDLHSMLEITQKPIGLLLSRVLEQAQTLSLGGRSVLTLGREHTLMQLCAHAALGHRFAGGLRWILDIHRFVSAHPIDWKALAKESGENPHWLWAPLRLSQELFHTEIPDAVFAVSSPQLVEIVRLAHEQLWADRHAPWAWAFSAPSVRENLARVFRRSNPWRAQTRVGELVQHAPHSLRDLTAGLKKAASKRKSIARLITAWKQGYFRRENLSQRVRLERARDRLGQLLSGAVSPTATRVSRRHLLARFFALTSHEQRLVFETVGLLWCARMGLLLLPYRIFEGSLRDDDSPSTLDPKVAFEVGEMIDRVARHVPWKAECLVQAAAGRWMLKRRHIASQLFLGVNNDPAGELQAHAWLRSGDMVLTGRLGHKQYSPLREI